ncbi:hypothetical protein [Sphingosinicella sp. CPCC 101087]|uniref:hypothetical protein n=1 Tax=Sphingosinicella sp. CPCC 101087 TaxID=2497754 RepID=UPI00101B8F2E|nr:hypothetical protein [Sphingosinicella sp. CPCC 101087]
MKIQLGILSGALAALAACQADPPPPDPERKSARRPPEPACEQARADLERRGRDGTFLFEDSGEAMTERDAWMRLNESRRDGLIGQLAVVAACSAETPQHEVEITIRDERGVVLTSQRVEPSTDFRAR